MSALVGFSQFVQKTFALWVVLFAGIAMCVPEVFIWLKSYITWMLGIIMFGMGMTMTLADFKGVLQSPKAVCIGVIAQFVLMPSLVYLLCQLFQLPAEIAVGVILVGCCPGGHRIQCDHLYGKRQYCIIGGVYFGCYLTGTYFNPEYFLSLS